MKHTKLKVVTVVGTRPEIIKLAATLKACDKYFDHTLIHTGQNWDYTLNEVFFKELGLRQPDYYMDAVGKDLGETMGNIITGAFKLLTDLKPDALLVLGDTNSALSAIAAKRLKIPIFHMEAGNRCFDENLPEEINRKIVDHISDVNLPYTEHARRYLLSEGIRKEHVFVTGSPMREIINKHITKIKDSKVLKTLKLKPQGYFLVSAHREENIDNEENFFSLMNALNDIAEQYKLPIIYSTHPRTQDRINKRGFKPHALIQNLKPFGYYDYNKLQQEAFCVLSDSGTLAEESAMLGFPNVSLRTSTERPEVLDTGAFIVGGITTEGIVQSIEMATEMAKSKVKVAPTPNYADDNVSVKVVKIIQSYTQIINNMVWRKN